MQQALRAAAACIQCSAAAGMTMPAVEAIVALFTLLAT
jgi:hypothetical protein